MAILSSGNKIDQNISTVIEKISDIIMKFLYIDLDIRFFCSYNFKIYFYFIFWFFLFHYHEFDCGLTGRNTFEGYKVQIKYNNYEQIGSNFLKMSLTHS